MEGWPAKHDQSDLERLEKVTPNDNTILVSPNRHTDHFHTDSGCPHVSVGFLVIPPDDHRHGEYRDELEKCKWCKYDSCDLLDLDGDGF